MRSSLEKFGLLGLGALAGVLLSLQLPAIAEKTSGSPLPVDELREFAEVFGRIKSDYVEPVSDKKLITLAINGMLSGLDPHSAYLDAEAYRDLQAGTQGEFGGLGIEVSMEDGLVKVISPIEDTPAYQAGLKTGDLILKIDDTLVKGMSLSDAVDRMRGKPGSKVTLTVLRRNEPKPLIFHLVRAVIKVKSVKAKMVEPGYAFVRITQFQEHTGESLATALTSLAKQGELKGIVLDLRNDPGGLLTSAVGVAAAFLPKDALVVYTEGRTEDARMRLTANPNDYLRGGATSDYLKDLPPIIKRVPMVVLVNGGSASASEIVAGALQDQERAVIMGTQSFGKGSVQTIIPLSDGSGLRLTTARYYTPNGTSIQAKGITPNIVGPQVELVKVENGKNLRESDLKHHFATPAPEKIRGTVATPPQQASQKFKLDKETRSDYQLMRALDLLKGWQVFKALKLPKAA